MYSRLRYNLENIINWMSDFRIVQYKDLNIPKWMSAKYDNCLQKYGLRANEFQRLPVY